MCVKEEEGVTGLVPFLTSLLQRKHLLLGGHVQQQVGNTVAVAKLIVIPRGREKERSHKFMSVILRTLLRTPHWKKGLKTNQEISLTKLSLREMPAPASKMEEWVSPMKSEDTTWKTEVTFKQDFYF